MTAAIEHDTEKFHIEVLDPEQTQDGDAKARINVKPQTDEDIRGYDEKIKIKGRTASEYANNVVGVYTELSQDDKDELKNEIMALKNEIRDKAAVTDNTSETEDSNTSETLEKRKWMEILQRTVASPQGMIRLEELEDEYPEVRDLQEKFDEHAVIYSGTLDVTQEGEEAVREYLGFDSFDGDPEAEALNQLENGNPLRYYLDSFNKIHKGDHLLKIWELISALSATCADRQIHSWAVGPSGKGKSHLKRKLLNFLPPEMYERKESFSPKALQYKANQKGSDILNNQLIYFDEVGEDDVDNAIELMRLITDQDQDVITHETVKDQELLTITLEADNITVWFTSVDTINDEQLKNRFILTNPDASSAQDQTVNEHQQNILNYGGDLDFIPREVPVIRRIFRNIREETPGYKPVVPFKIDWKQKFNRRLYPFFYTLMGMIAKIHYKNRVKRNGYIFVTKTDFELAKLIWGRLIDTTVAQTDEQSIKLLKELPESESDALSRQELRLRLNGFSTNKVSETCENLEETEELQLINTKYEDGKYKHWAGGDVEKLVDNEPEILNLEEKTVKEMVKETGIETDEELLENIFEEEISVIDYLEEKLEQRKNQEQQEEEDEKELPELTDDEIYALKQFNKFGWEADLNSMNQMHQSEDDPNFVKTGTDLEEKDVIRIDEENMPYPTSTLDELKAEGEVVF